MNVCVIPARGGSKRIPRKNIKSFCGVPMIAYSIKVALASECFDKVIVSTDDMEIADVARSYGAEVPFIRPPHLSDDFTGTIPVVKHAIEWLIDHQIVPNNVCCLYATAPFVQANSIRQALAKMQASLADYCFSVTSYAFPIQRAIQVNPNDRVEMFSLDNFNQRSQDLEEAFHDAGQFYWGTAQAWLQEKVLFSEVSLPYVLPRYLVQDIDTKEDWIRAELMYQALCQQGIL